MYRKLLIALGVTLTTAGGAGGSSAAAAGAGDPCTGAFAAYAEYLDSGVTCPVVADDGGEEGGDAGAGMGDAGADVGTDAAGDAPATD